MSEEEYRAELQRLADEAPAEPLPGGPVWKLPERRPDEEAENHLRRIRLYLEWYRGEARRRSDGE